MLKNRIVKEIDATATAIAELAKHAAKIKRGLNALVALQEECEHIDPKSEDLEEFCDMDFAWLFSSFQDTLDNLHSCARNLTEIDFN